MAPQIEQFDDLVFTRDESGILHMQRTQKKPRVNWEAEIDRLGLSFTFAAIPEDELTDRICETYVTRFAFIPEGMPERFMTPDFALFALDRNLMNWKRLPKTLRTEAFTLTALNLTNGRVMKELETDEQTPEVCLVALRLDPTAARFINAV